MTSGPHQHPNPTIFARIRARAMRRNLRLAVRSQRLGAVACLVAMCGVIFGVGAAFAQPGAARPVRSARVAHVSIRSADHGARAHRRYGRRLGVRAYRHAHRARRHHKHARRLYMRRMAVRAARARARAAHARAVRARAARAHARRQAQRRHKKLRHGKRGRRLMMRAFIPGAAATTATLGQSLPGSLIAVARPGSGSLVPVASGSRTAGTALSGSGGAQIGALAAQVRAVATTGTYSGGATSTRTPSATKPAHAHRAGGHSSDTTFLLPIGVPSPIEHFVNVVPEPLWIALASALALAGIGGIAALRSGRRARLQAGEYAAVAAVALTDPLTGVLNRRGFTDEVERELARARRYDAPFVLAYVDVRGLKAVNDSEGHLAGDAVIREVARLLAESVRAEDAVGRLGGDELALLLTGQSASGADAVVERIRAHVPECRDRLDLRTDWDVTIGTASYPADGGSFDELVSTADRRLYEQRGIHLR